MRIASLFAIISVTILTANADEVSFHKQIRPILQANCIGCHQPAKANGQFVMTEFSALLKGGESGDAAIIAGEPAASGLVSQIMPNADGHASMPPNGPPLSADEIDTIQRWIAEGARDDSPANSSPIYSPSNPPVYSAAPVITSIDFSPDGQLIAVAGFHEVLLHQADGSKIVARLIGQSERIESVRFSPDGTRLAITGGRPGRSGEIQVWDTQTHELLLSKSVTFDTIYGASWSGDGKQIAFGCSDNTVRAIDAQTGEQVLYQGAHNDWVRDTVFTVAAESPHVLSVSRDMTVKLTEVSTNRFIDNVTSITPKALKGGVNSIARHPQRDEIVVGGADGVPKIYRVFRITARKIGDDSNLIRRLSPMTGRVFGVDISTSGKMIAAVSSLDGTGQVSVYSYEFDTSLTPDLKKIVAKRRRDRKADEQKKLDAYRSKDIKRLVDLKLDDCPLYAVSIHPTNGNVAVAGGDGRIRLIDVKTGTIVTSFAAAPIDTDNRAPLGLAASDLNWSAPPMLQSDPLAAQLKLTQETESADQAVNDLKVIALHAEPTKIELKTPFEYSQLLITAQLSNGEKRDVTRLVQIEGPHDALQITESGFVKPIHDGNGKLKICLQQESIQVPFDVTGQSAPFVADFVHDVNPILTRVGCNQGTCHGAAKGKNGFKLSLRGYDPIFDIRAFTDDLAGRRTNVASPKDSLMLLKATSAVAHQGGQVIKADSNYYEIVRNWIQHGAKLKTDSPQVHSISISPANPVIQQIQSTQQIRIVAQYSDGTSKDVTREAFITSGNTEVAVTNRWGLMTAIRRGEAPILARFEGAYAATTLTVMGDRTGFEWQPPETWSTIDELVAAKWKRLKIDPSDLCSDVEFLRRVHLDLTGLPPSVEQVTTFLADTRPTREKRDAVVDSLIGNENFVDFWTNKWADLLQVNRKFLGPEGSSAFRNWIRKQVATNQPYDEFVRSIITADGSNKDNPAASYYKILREPADIMENTTHLFLGVRFNCNKCHDHPFEKWTQDQYYETAAYFARVGLKADPASGKRKIGGTAVQGAKPFYEVVFEKEKGEIKHDRTGAVTAPKFPFKTQHSLPATANRRQQLASWMTAPDNQYFARSYVNRLWGYMFGVGIREPIDDLRAGNPPTNPELLEFLTTEFINSQFDIRHVMKLICKSRTYQLSLRTNKWNEDDQTNFSHAKARRLPAEVLYDSIHRVLGVQTTIPGVAKGTRAAALPDAGVRLTDGFLANLGRPVRESACECERSSDLQLGPIMALVGGPTVGSALADPASQIAQLTHELQDDHQLVNQLFLRILNRPATDAEIAAAIKSMQEIEIDHQHIQNQLNEREAWWVNRKADLESERQQNIKNVKQQLAKVEKEIAPQRKQLEAERVKQVAAAKADLEKYSSELPEKAAQRLTTPKDNTEWHMLSPEILTAPNGMVLHALGDRSIKATGKADKGAYTIVARTQLQNIHSFRIEALPDSSFQGNGPGIPQNGNFVVTEFEVLAASADKPKQFKPIKLVNPKADFLQAGFRIEQTIDKNKGNQNAWAVASAGGVVHWATFPTAQPIANAKGAILKFVIHQNHNAKQHLLGRFRISLSTEKSPGLSLPESLAAIRRTNKKNRNQQQLALLNEWFTKVDSTLMAKRNALKAAQKPLAEDAQVAQLKEKLAIVSQDIREDSSLTRLRSDADHSDKQLKSKRLTAAQDLAWALINSPAFLFNH